MELLHIEMNSWPKFLYWLGGWKVVNMAVLGGKPLHCSSFLSEASYLDILMIAFVPRLCHKSPVVIVSVPQGQPPYTRHSNSELVEKA